MGLTRIEALKRLRLKGNPDIEEVKKAYEKMVRRYPPEFHPEKFQEIEEAYIFLTSLTFRLERAGMQDHEMPAIVFPEPPAQDRLSELVEDLKREKLYCILFK